MYISKLSSQNQILYNYRPYLNIKNKSSNIDNTSFKANQINPCLLRESKVLAEKYYGILERKIPQFDLVNNKLVNNLKAKDIPRSLLDSIAYAELEKMSQIPAEKQLYIITGRCGSGKTTFTKNDMFKNFYTPDADVIKPLLPEYKTKGSQYVHEASYFINKTNLLEALEKGLNCVFQTTTTVENIDKFIEKARRYGYQDIKLIHINVSEKKAIERCDIREQKTGRKIDPDIIIERKYIDNIVSVYKDPKKGISEIFLYDNNGNSPVLIDQILVK